jgi:hypothetical protein
MFTTDDAEEQPLLKGGKYFGAHSLNPLSISSAVHEVV